MNRIVEFYQINHLSVLIAVVFFLGIYILKLKTKILDYISKQEEYKNKKIRIGSIVKLKYILTGEVVTLKISEYQSGLIENQSEIRRINSKMPLAVSLLDKEAGDIIKFKVNISDEKEVYVEVLKVGVEIEQQPKEVIVEVDKSKINNESEISNDEIQPTEFTGIKEVDNEIPCFGPDRVTIGSIVRLKYISTDEIILILITEYQSGKIENQPDINRLYYKNPLAVALLNKEVGDKVEFRLNELDENEVNVEVLAINNEFVEDNEEGIIEINKSHITKDSEAITNLGYQINPNQDINTVGFCEWLINEKEYQTNTVQSRLSNCQTVENHHGSLYTHFLNNKGNELIGLFKYSRVDERENLPVRHEININGDLYNGTATYRQAIRLYMEFLDEQDNIGF